MKTLDAAGTEHVAHRHTDRVRLAAHRFVTRRAVEDEYGGLPERMRLVVLPISTFGAIGTSFWQPRTVPNRFWVITLPIEHS